MSETNSKTIDLRPCWGLQKQRRDKVIQLEQQLIEAQKSAAAAASDWKEVIIGGLDAGQTTGDSFQDELIRWLGLGDKDAFDKFVAFNQRLVESKGQEFLLMCSYQVQTVFSLDSNDYTTCWGNVFGILSGDPIRISLSPFETMTLPLERCVAWGWQAGERSQGRAQVIVSCQHIGDPAYQPRRTVSPGTEIA
jgi:hypothetical protein